MFDMQSFCAVASTPSGAPRSDLVRQIKAQTAAEAALENLRCEARRQAETAYAQGPGRKRVRGWETLPETNAIYRREKKTRSAYVSRFKAKEYERLLENRLHVVSISNDETRQTLAKENQTHEQLIRKICDLKRQLAANTSSSTSPTISEMTSYGSPINKPQQVQQQQQQQFSFEPFPLLGVSKINPGEFEDCWSVDDENDDAVNRDLTANVVHRQLVNPSSFLFGQ